MSDEEILTLRLEPTAPQARTEIRVEEGLWDRLPDLLVEDPGAPAYALVADEGVAKLYAGGFRDALEARGARAQLFTFPPGESSKTPARWAELVEGFGEMGLGRDGCVVGVGGGVTTDLAGFTAATYARGVSYVAVPTSLLGMIDAAIGGKSGVDLRAGKNLAGAFHHPLLVAVDPALLETLPDEEYRTGLAEAVKHGAIADEAYFDFLAGAADTVLDRDPAAVRRLIRGSVEIKAGVVKRDAAETGERAMLNFGHTIGHGVERVTQFAIDHGNAVGIGLVAEARLGERIGITDDGTADRIRNTLEALQVRVDLPAHVDPGAVIQAAQTDKKAREGKVRYALIEGIGRPARLDGEWTHAVPDDEAATVLGPGFDTPHAV